MENCTSKILLAISIVFGIATAYEVVYCVAEPLVREEKALIALVFLAASGLFLGLSRIIDLLER